MNQETTRTGQLGDPQGSVFSRVPEPLPPHGAQLDLTTKPLKPAVAAPVTEPQTPAAPAPEELITVAQTPPHTPAPVPSSWSTPASTELTPAPVKRPKAVKVFKWSASLGVLCFFLFGLCIETFDPDAESFIAGVFALGFFFGGLTAAISGVWVMVNRLMR